MSSDTLARNSSFSGKKNSNFNRSRIASIRLSASAADFSPVSIIEVSEISAMARLMKKWTTTFR